jgi:hypothetical protein
MDKLIAAITDWPALAQALVAAAAFAALAAVGTKAYNSAYGFVASLSKGNRVYRLKNELIRCMAVKAGEGENLSANGLYAAILWYRAARQLIKALIWMTFGLVATPIPAFSTVGFLGCLFYLLSAFQVVRPYAGSIHDIDTKISDLKREIDLLESAATHAGKT